MRASDIAANRTAADFHAQGDQVEADHNRVERRSCRLGALQRFRMASPRDFGPGWRSPRLVPPSSGDSQPRPGSGLLSLVRFVRLVRVNDPWLGQPHVHVFGPTEQRHDVVMLLEITRGALSPVVPTGLGDYPL